MPTGHVALGWVQDLRVEVDPGVRATAPPEGDGGAKPKREETGGWATNSASDFIDDMVLGSRIQRYTRTWIMGRSGYQDRDVWGRIGYISRGDGREVWDEEEQDFREAESSMGSSAPFVVNAATGRLSFQFRPNLFGRSAYCLALEALVNGTYTDSEQPARWRVWADLGELSWDQWVETAGAVTRLSFRISGVRRPLRIRRCPSLG